MCIQYLDAEVLPDEGEEGGGEVDPPLPVQGHVHADEPLVGHLVGALLPEPEGRVDVLQQLHGLRVVDGAPEQDFFYKFQKGFVTFTTTVEALFLDVSMECHDTQTGV